jgi:hypothetical protein
LEFNGVKYPVIPAGSVWSEDEKMAFVSVYADWELQKSASDVKRSMSQQRQWCLVIPGLMALKFGKIRHTPGGGEDELGLVSNSPYKSQLGNIKADVSDYKYLNTPDSPEEERAAKEGPSGGGADEYGNVDERMERQEEEEEQKEKRKKERLLKKFGASYDSVVRVVEYYMEKFPQSIAGMGVRSERSMMSGDGRK